MLGTFLGIGEEFSSIPFILRCSGAAWSGAGERANFHYVASQPHMHLRRAPNKGEIITEFETKHVRRWVDETEASIKIERVAAEIGFEALRQDNLEDITCADVFLGSFHCLLELVRMKIAVVETSLRDVRTARRAVPTNGLRFGICRWNKRKFSRFRKFVRDDVDRFNRSRIDVFERAIFKERVRDDLQSAQAMVEDEKSACDHEDHLGQLQFIALRYGNFGFKEMNRFVPEETDSAAAETGKFRTRHKLIARHQLADLI